MQDAIPYESPEGLVEPSEAWGEALADPACDGGTGCDLRQQSLGVELPESPGAAGGVVGKLA